jgi:hypothetical protein
MERRERSYNGKELDRVLRELEIKVSAYNSYLHHCGTIKQGAETIEAVDQYLNEKTGFVNARLSADALGLLDVYEKIVQLENTFLGLNTAILSASKKGKHSKIYQVSDEHIESLKQHYTTYYSVPETSQLNDLDKAIKILNALDVAFKSAIAYNRLTNEWVWAKQHTDNTLVMNKSRF